MQNITHYIPILTTLIAFSFTVALYKHWRYKPEANTSCGGLSAHSVSVLAHRPRPLIHLWAGVC
jgi:hypothetical protein